MPNRAEAPDQRFDRRAEASDARRSDARCARAGRHGGTRQVSHDGREQHRAARRDQRMARASSCVRGARSVPRVLPVLGSREALFAFAQTVIDGSRAGFHGRRAQSFLSDLRRRSAARRRADVLRERGRDRRFRASVGRVPDDVWMRSCCTCARPSNPTGRVIPLAEWQVAVRAARIATTSSSRPTNAIPRFRAKRRPPLARSAPRHEPTGRDGAIARLVVFGSLSTRGSSARPDYISAMRPGDPHARY